MECDDFTNMVVEDWKKLGIVDGAEYKLRHYSVKDPYKDRLLGTCQVPQICIAEDDIC